MKEFMDKDFMLQNDAAKELYHSYAEQMPIFDWHCHLSPKEIWENKKYENITQVWLGGDHYKWRAMRSIGVDETYITGNETTDREKFDAWAKSLPYFIGNPLYHWTHLELQRFFGITKPLDETTADEIWEQTKEMLKKDEFSPRGLIEQSNVVAVCTTDDPADSLEYHVKIKEEGKLKTKVVPAMRPDKALQIANGGFADYVKSLAGAADMSIGSFAQFTAALAKRFDFFDEMGCCASDHAFECAPYKEAGEAEIEAIFQKALDGKEVTNLETEQYQTALMMFLSSEYSRRGWVMELHIGATRNNNTRMFEKLGADTGFDAIADGENAKTLSRLLDKMQMGGHLPKTVLFNLNPKDNYVLSTLMGCFQSGEVPGKIQFGSAWWFLDNRYGMEEQLKTYAMTGVVSKFVGMVTDSRSFLSYPRHEYFRRILCNLIGQWVEDGEYPYNKKYLEEIVQGISFKNAEGFFDLNK